MSRWTLIVTNANNVRNIKMKMHVGELLAGSQDVAPLPSRASFPPHFLEIVVKVKASEPPHVVRLWLGVSKVMFL